MTPDLDTLRYPIGKFQMDPTKLSSHFISQLENFPEELKELVSTLDETSMKWHYRPNGWQIYQVVHHIADSHVNAYTRMKVAYTESGKTITPYNESAWAKLSDVQSFDLSDSLTIISLVHKKLVTFLKGLSGEEWNRIYFHPEDKVAVSLAEAVQIYAWHGNHHLTHIKQGLAAKGKY